MVRGLLALSLLALAGCSGMPQTPPEYAPTLPPVATDSAPANGAIYNARTSMTLFRDPIAHRPGDILTIRLVEQTSAEKSATTSTKKSTAGDTGSPTIFGKPVTYNGDPILSAAYDSKHNFSGEGDSSQSNKLTGEITVTVAQRLSNGNLVIHGEKWVTINQGSELVRLSGIVRPSDIGSDNSVPSYKVANAHIRYTGKGALAESNRKGWLARFFSSGWMPF